MKKYFVMALAALLPLAFVSCGSDGDNGGGTSSTTTLPTLSTASSKIFTGISAKSGSGYETRSLPNTAEFDPTNLSTLHFPKVAGDPGYGEVLDLTGGGSAKARNIMRTMGPVDPWEFEWVIGNYTFSNNCYDIGNGAIQVNIAGGDANLVFTFYNGETTTTINATATSSNYNVYNGSQVGGWICRSWKVTSTELEMTQGSSYGKFWEGCDFVQIANDIKQHADFDDAVLRELGGLRKIRFTPAGRIYFHFLNGAKVNLYAGEWKLTNNTFNWALDGNVGNDLINANGTGEITFDGNTAAIKLTVKAGDNGKYQGFVTFTLLPM